MDLAEYDRVKFGLADILRSASLRARELNPKVLYPFEDLFSRLADDRFNIVVVGQFSRGKTSLMNAMLNTTRLPTGIVPLTSVITTVQYGTREHAVLEYREDRRLPLDVPLASLAEYITQRCNPGNALGIRFARIELPSELLRRGFYLVDTPGLGSAILENTRTTESFLPEADAFILVTSYDSPLSDEELRLLQNYGTTGCKVFIVINKQDLASPDERQDVREHVRSQLRAIFGEGYADVFSLSAREAMEANQTGDVEHLLASGVPAFVDGLTSFLVDEKQAAFLRRMCDRIGDRLQELGECFEALKRLGDLQQELGVGDKPFTTTSRPITASNAAVVVHFDSCLICSHIEREVYDFLRQYQYHISIDAKVQRELAEAGGLCAFHTWQYAAIASPHGTCNGFPGVLEHFARSANSLADSYPDERTQWGPQDPQCALCRVQAKAETAALVEASRLITRAAQDGTAAFPDVCLSHVPKVLNAISDRDVAQRFLRHEANVWTRVAEDMRRYALKRDGSRRAFTTDDELDAHIRGLIALAGHKNVAFPHRER